jgi:hypothetical protein
MVVNESAASLNSRRPAAASFTLGMRFGCKSPVHSRAVASSSIEFGAHCNLRRCSRPDSATHFHCWHSLQVLDLGCSPSTVVDHRIKHTAAAV